MYFSEFQYSVNNQSFYDWLKPCFHYLMLYATFLRVMFPYFFMMKNMVFFSLIWIWLTDWLQVDWKWENNILVDIGYEWQFIIYLFIYFIYLFVCLFEWLFVYLFIPCVENLKDQQLICRLHDDMIISRCFPQYWPHVRGIHRWPVVSQV